MWSKDYSVDYVKAFTKVWSKTWQADYVKDWVEESYQRDTGVSYTGTAFTSGVAGSGGAGFIFGVEGTTESPDAHLLTLPKSGTLLYGGDNGTPDLQYGHSRIRGGKGGNLGEAGTGGGERLLNKSRFAQCGDGGLPGAAIDQFDYNRVTFIHQGNILGDPQFKFVGEPYYLHPVNAPSEYYKDYAGSYVNAAGTSYTGANYTETYIQTAIEPYDRHYHGLSYSDDYVKAWDSSAATYTKAWAAATTTGYAGAPNYG